MRSKNTFGIQFTIRLPKQHKNGLATMFARITVNGRRSEISLKKKIDPKSWDEIRGKAKSRTDDAGKLNEYIERMRSQIFDCYHQLIQEKKAISVDAVKARYLGEDKDEMTLRNLCAYHNVEMKGKLAQGTMKNYYTTQNYIEKFLRDKYRRQDIVLTELNYKFIMDFQTYLRTHKPKRRHRPLNNNGIMKHIERLRKMVNIAVTMDWLDKDPFAKYKMHFEKVERAFLNQEELNSIINKTFTIERLQFVRDMFLFSCYTGLSYIDAMSLTKENLIKGIDGENWITTNRQKTDTIVRLPLLPQASDLIQKYSTHPKALHLGTLFPVISNQKMNSYLKEIANICGIIKPMSFHIARHTFATTITLSNGVPIETVSKMLGHTTIRTTQIYAKVVESKLSQDMANLRNRLEKNEKSNSNVLKA